MNEKVDILSVLIDNVTLMDAGERVQAFLDEEKVHTIYTPNSEILMTAHRNDSFKSILNQADLLLPDGAGVVLASRILGKNLPERVTGFDLMKCILVSSNKRKIRFFLLGGQPGVAEDAAIKILDTYPGTDMAGYRNGYFTKDEETTIINDINSSNADVLFVALGGQKQEEWIHTNKSRLNVRVCMGVGGSLDIIAGRVKLAPDFFRNNGLEWLYRLYKQPWRFKRMLSLPAFILHILALKIKSS